MRSIARGVNHGEATLRKLRCSGGSISMMVRIAPTPSSRVMFTSLREWTMPGALRNSCGAFEISQMSAWRVMAQKGG
jgi:hypothetical protein